MEFIIKGFFEVAIESWPELDLNPRPLNSRYYHPEKIIDALHYGIDFCKQAD